MKEAALSSPVDPVDCCQRLGLLKVDCDDPNHTILGLLFSTDFTLYFCCRCTDSSAAPELDVSILTALGPWVSDPHEDLKLLQAIWVTICIPCALHRLNTNKGMNWTYMLLWLCKSNIYFCLFAVNQQRVEITALLEVVFASWHLEGGLILRKSVEPSPD